MTLTRPASRGFFLTLCVLFVTHMFWLPAHLAFEDHCFGGEGAQHYHHHPHDHHDDGHGHHDRAGHHDHDVSGQPPELAQAPDADHHHHDPAHHPHPAQVHYQELLASRLKDTAVAPDCPVPEEATFEVRLEVTVHVAAPPLATVCFAPEPALHGPRGPPAV